MFPTAKSSSALIPFADSGLYIVCVFEMSSEQEDQEILDVNSVCARKPVAIPPSQTEDVNEDRGDGSNAPDASKTRFEFGIFKYYYGLTFFTLWTYVFPMMACLMGIINP